MTGSPHVSVVVCTYNRAPLLEEALDALTQQSAPDTPYEVIVVDNNSNDRTDAAVSRACRRSKRVRCLFEPVQGLSAARNLGIRAARAPLVAFTDDDVRVAPDFVSAIARAFAEWPDAEWIGGKVLPVWDAAPPLWLDEAGWAPLAIVDYGPTPVPLTRARGLCAIGANMAVRRRAFDAAGLFSTAVERRGDSIGSTEDHDLQVRFWEHGFNGWYDPRVVAHAMIDPRRLQKTYHRAWHEGHGRFYSLMREPSFERSGTGAVFGVPAHVFRSAASELAGCVGEIMRGRPSRAFGHELKFRFLFAYARHRVFARDRR